MGDFKKWLSGAAVALALPVAAATAMVGQAHASEAANATRTWNQTQNRQQHMQEFIRNHSDTSGKYRPDLMRAAIEHTRQMQVAPSIGSHPPPLPAVKSVPASH